MILLAISMVSGGFTGGHFYYYHNYYYSFLAKILENNITDVKKHMEEK